MSRSFRALTMASLWIIGLSPRPAAAQVTESPEPAPPGSMESTEPVTQPETMPPEPASPPPAPSAPQKPRLAAPAPAPAGYQDLSLVNLMNLDVPEITAASKRAEKATAAPATVIVISKEDIRLRGYSYLKEVLRDLPGMETHEYAWSEMGTFVPVRGIAGNNKIIVLVNGVRVNPPGGEWMVFKSDISVRFAEQVEIIYGPGSTLYGQDAISLVINIITLKPAKGTHAMGGAGAGYPVRGEGYAGLSHTFGTASVSAYVQYFNAQLTDLPSEYPDEWERSYASVARGKTVGARSDAGLEPVRYDRGFNAFAQLRSDVWATQAWVRRASRSSSEGFPGFFGKIRQAKWIDTSIVLETKNLLKLSEQTGLESALTFNRYEVDPASRYVFPATANDWMLDDWKYATSTSVSLEEKFHADLGERVSFLAGMVGSHYDVIPKATVPGRADTTLDLVSQGGAFEYYESEADALAGENVLLAQRVHNLKYQGLGAYAEGTLRIIDPLRAVVGARADLNTRFDEVPISPRFALIYDPTSEVTIKGIFTGAYVSPAPYFSYNVYSDGVSINRSNPDLKPERAWSSELNVSYSSKVVAAGVSGYYNVQEDLWQQGDLKLPGINALGPIFVRNADGTVTEVELTQSGNGGHSRAFGADIYGKLHLGPALLSGSYSFTDFRAQVPGQPDAGLQQISRHNVRFLTTVTPFSKLSVTGSFQIRSTPENVPELEGEPFALSPTLVFDTTLDDEMRWPWEVGAHILYAATEHLDVYLDGRNITNNKTAVASRLWPVPVAQETLRAMGGARVAF